MESQAQQEELSRPGLGYNNPPGSFRVFPNLSGRRAKISERDDVETRRGLYRENESADIIFAYGHSLEQKPIIEGRKNPDFLIDAEIFDNYAPKTGSPRNIRGYVEQKVRENQAKSIILNLRDTVVSKEEIEQVLLEEPIEGLNRLWIIDKSGMFHYLLGGRRWK